MRHLAIAAVLLYTLTAADAEAIQRTRANSSGAFRGNPVAEGETYPLVVSRSSGEFVNGQVLLDGNDSLWVTSVHEDTETTDVPKPGYFAPVPTPPEEQTELKLVPPPEPDAPPAASETGDVPQGGGGGSHELQGTDPSSGSPG